MAQRGRFNRRTLFRPFDARDYDVELEPMPPNFAQFSRAMYYRQRIPRQGGNIVRDLIDQDVPIGIPFRFWPLRFKMMFLKRRKTNPERFRLTMFLVANGMPPEFAPHWVLWHGGYDYDAVRDVLTVALRLRNPRSRLWMNSTYVVPSEVYETIN